MNPLLRKTFWILVFISLQMGPCKGQSVYFKTGANYQIPVNKQQQPRYFDLTSYFPGGGTIYVNTMNTHFSIAKGFCFQEIVGYNINNFLSVEFNISYFSNAQKNFDAYPKPVYAMNGTTNWNYQNIGLTPTIAIARTCNKSTVKICVFSGIGFSNLEVKASLYDSFDKYTFDRSISYSYGYGLEYQYSLSELFQVYANMGINNLIYIPKHSELCESNFRDLEYMHVYQKEIDYVKEIKNYKSVNTEPEKRIQEALKLNSFYFGMGIKFTITKNDQK